MLRRSRVVSHWFPTGFLVSHWLPSGFLVVSHWFSPLFSPCDTRKKWFPKWFPPGFHLVSRWFPPQKRPKQTLLMRTAAVWVYARVLPVSMWFPCGFRVVSVVPQCITSQSPQTGGTVVCTMCASFLSAPSLPSLLSVRYQARTRSSENSCY